MILLFLIVLLFVGYVLVFSHNMSKEIGDKKVFYLSCILVIFAFLVYFIKRDKIALNFSFGAFLGLTIGPLLLLLLKDKESKIYYHFLPLIVFSLVDVISFFFVPSFYCWYLPFLDDILFATVALSCIIYGSYGYLYVVREELSFEHNSIVISYIVLLFSCAFFFGLLFFKSPKVLDIDYVYMIYCFFLIGVALLTELNVALNCRQQNANPRVLDPREYLIKGEGKQVVWSEFVQELPDEHRENKKEVEHTEKQERIDVIRQKLSKNLIETKLYLEPNLTIDQVATVIRISKKELTDYFKKGNSTNFRKYINRLKVEYAVNLIQEKNKDITVEELAFYCGFNTRLSFYRAFVQWYGFPPSALLDK
ncbi:helix-turn-helix domain-containing protein [Myroides profundi]|uniref:Transcriptional regulator, AraC family n=1 Tax=Myroides profundi TaxID=480520 RepID=A0AAJ5BEH3_MYRPR|nr:AraC family transcriptional regulator [Myroides profundi]SER12518.1 transcriptional regulator, AraC family [Myroides profundi]